jgi:hypothetical protein
MISCYETLTDPNPKFNDISIEDWYKKEFKVFTQKYADGNKYTFFHKNKEQYSYLAEYERALQVLKYKGFEALKIYSINPVVVEDIQKAYKKQFSKSNPENRMNIKKGQRKQKYALAENWCKKNAGKKVTIKDVMAASKWSYPTANKFIQNRPDLFNPGNKKFYILRNPDLERKNDKIRVKNQTLTLKPI